MPPPDAPVCAHCERPVRLYRRRLCRSCYRKLLEQYDYPFPDIPPDGRAKPLEVWFVAWVMTLPDQVQQALFNALQQRARETTDAS